MLWLAISVNESGFEEIEFFCILELFILNTRRSIKHVITAYCDILPSNWSDGDIILINRVQERDLFLSFLALSYFNPCIRNLKYKFT